MYTVDIDKQHRRVVTTWGRRVNDASLMTYQQTVWNDPAVIGFSEIIDFRAVEEVEVTAAGLEAVAYAAAEMDSRIGQGRFAVVAGDGLAFGLSRMYEAFREMQENATRSVMIFRRMADALAWLEETPAP